MLPNYEFMERLLVMAKIKGFTINDFEQKIGTTSGYITRHTLGKQRENADIRFNIFRESAKLFGMKLSEFFAYLENLDVDKVKQCPVCNKKREVKKVLLEKINDDTYYCHICKTEFRFLKDKE